MNAEETLAKIIQEDGRQAVLRFELLNQAKASSAASCDRALRRRCDDGTLVRVGHGIYGIGSAKIFQIVPEVLPKLGYSIHAVERIKGYSQKSAGAIWRLDRDCKRTIRKRGVWAQFEGPTGEITNDRRIVMPFTKQPSQKQIADHFHSFEYCHSESRAEKDLLVQRALDALESFQDDRAQFAIEGGTALAYYHRLITRFSEDLNIRVIPDYSMNGLPTDEMITQMKKVGQSFKDHLLAEMPFLRSTRKGGIRTDAVLQTLIFDYTPLASDDEVMAGLKFELALVPTLLPIKNESQRSQQEFRAISIVETAAGKMQALGSRLPDHGDSYADLIRHVHDLAMLFPVLEEGQIKFRSTTVRGDLSPDRIRRIIDELSKPIWETHYIDYMRRMGTRPISNQPGYHPEWQWILKRIRQVASLLI